MIWIVFFALIFAVLALLVVPLLQSGKVTADRSDYDLTVYRDQLTEVESDLERGLLSPAQAEAARTEIKRRMLAAADRPEPPAKAGRAAKAVAALVVVLVPLGTVSLYALLGHPNLPDMPFASRTDKDEAKKMADINAMVEGLAERLKQRPDDAEGWTMLARSARMLERFDLAADSYRHLIALGKRSADNFAGLGESVLFTSESFTPEAAAAFQDALRVDPTDVRSRFYLGIGVAEAGDARGAIAIWRDLEQSAPAGAEWLAGVRERIAEAATKAGIDPKTVPPKPPILPPAGQQPAAAATAAPPMAPGGDSQAMIQSMVDRLAARLKDNPDDGDGWKRLGRAYRVQKKLDLAKEAYGKAVALLPKDVEAKLGYADVLLAQAPADAKEIPASVVAVLTEILALDERNADALYYLGLSEAQAGRKDSAKTYWTRLLATLPADSPERAGLQKQIDGLGG